MFESVRRYFWDRRRGMITLAGVVSGGWLLGRYVMGRLEEMRDKVMQDRAARENLRKRFQQNQEDCTYHVLALFPSLGNQILEEMDVEHITLALQHTRASATHQPQAPSSSDFSSNSLLRPAHEATLSESVISSATSGTDSHSQSMSNSLHLETSPPPEPLPPSLLQGATNDALNAASIPIPSSPVLETSGLLNSTSDWVAEFQASQFGSQQLNSNQSPSRRSDSVSVTGTTASMSLPPTEDESEAGVESVSAQSQSQSAVMIDSTMSLGPIASHDIEVGPSVEASEPAPVPPTIGAEPTYHIPPYLANKTKAELWKEMKILAFTRALTILYSLTLLSVFTHIQLNLLGTRKYVQSVKQLAREQARGQASSSSGASLGALFFGPPHPAFDRTDGEDGGEYKEDGEEDDEAVSGETERKYLTLSWWLLNVGWKDVGQRVRDAVEVVFSGVSLKAQLNLSDLERMIDEVRRRVEYQDITASQRVSFLGTMLPGSELDQEFVLLQGGLSSADARLDNPTRSLIADTISFVESAEFNAVFGACLDRGTEILIQGLREGVFEGGQEGDGGQLEIAGVRLAAMLPFVSRWSHLAVNGIPNELVERLSEIREMTAFSAILYSSLLGDDQ